MLWLLKVEYIRNWFGRPVNFFHFEIIVDWFVEPIVEHATREGENTK